MKQSVVSPMIAITLAALLGAAHAEPENQATKKESFLIPGKQVAAAVQSRLKPGQFIGEMSFLSGNRAAADVVTTEPCRVLAWPQPALARLLDKSSGLSFKLRAVLGRDVVAKLRAHGEEAD